MVSASLVDAVPSFEQFVTESFDSDEAAMVILVLRAAGRALSAADVLAALERQYDVQAEEPRRLSEKRIELRLRDLVTRGLVEQLPGAQFRYSGNKRGVDALVDELAIQFDTNRAAVDRLIYSVSSKARRLAEAFRL